MRISDWSSDVCSSDLVAQALIGMARKLTPDVPRIAMAIVSAALMLIIAVPAAQIGLIAIGAVAGLLLCRTGTGDPISNVRWTPSHRTGIEWLAIFTTFHVVLQVLASTVPAPRLS